MLHDVGVVLGRGGRRLELASRRRPFARVGRGEPFDALVLVPRVRLHLLLAGHLHGLRALEHDRDDAILRGFGLRGVALLRVCFFGSEHPGRDGVRRVRLVGLGARVRSRALHPVLALELRHLVLAELQHALDGASLVVADVLHVLERDLEPQLAQRPLVEGLPVVHLLRHGVRAAVVVQLDETRVEVRDDLGDEHAVGKVASDVSLGPRQRDLVDPLVQRLELRVGDLHGERVRLVCRGAAWVTWWRAR
mmetsp:Transcript_1465/g.6549  ORF Transcript_1465/g.6549 Transcript_1465/m.6549 type:complete len:250 (-) Transcript_1465:134-883(-)